MAEEEIPRNPQWAIPLVVVAAGLLGLTWFWARPTPIAFGLIAIAMFVIFGLFYLGLSYDGPKSRLYGLKPITSRMPAVAQPKGHVHFRTKLFWLVGVLLLYFVLTNIFLYG